MTALIDHIPSMGGVNFPDDMLDQSQGDQTRPDDALSLHILRLMDIYPSLVRFRASCASDVLAAMDSDTKRRLIGSFNKALGIV